MNRDYKQEYFEALDDMRKLEIKYKKLDITNDEYVEYFRKCRVEAKNREEKIDNLQDMIYDANEKVEEIKEAIGLVDGLIERLEENLF